MRSRVGGIRRLVVRVLFEGEIVRVDWAISFPGSVLRLVLREGLTAALLPYT